MPDQPDITARIEQILRDNDLQDSAGYFAELLVTKLGMREERNRANARAILWFNRGPWVRRFVTRWEWVADA